MIAFPLAAQAGTGISSMYLLAESISVYLAPFAAGLAAVLLAVWHFQRETLHKKTKELEAARRTIQQLEHQRDLAQDELFRRLYEERELNKEKVQFQAQLAEYEKYAALARLAVGAAHEINNPLLGILSHLELELRVASDPE